MTHATETIATVSPRLSALVERLRERLELVSRDPHYSMCCNYRLVVSVREAIDEAAQLSQMLELANEPTTVPDWIHESLHRWVEGHVPPGDFLSAILRNDLKEAFARADADSARSLHAIVSHCYQHLPANCWGSEGRFEAWRKR